MSTVMVVDDEERIREMLTRMLTSEGHTTVTATDGLQALQALARRDVDLILLDLVMPNSHGMRVLMDLHARGSTTPVIVLSAVSDVSARVEAFGLGAVDFVGKPFHSAELVARVRRHLTARAVPATIPRVPEQRRKPEGRFLVAGGIELDLDRRRAHHRGQQVSLTEREFSLLAHLMRRQGEVCSRTELLHSVWGLDFDPGTNVIEACVRRLRCKLRELPVETVRSVGYCFDAA
ncbi:response regulator transcription factor [Nocardioides mesophilus]|uniref:Response regulator transcription factor n=1 Tax=Nocardioides mesophilus TaxID=433659 RepID=A0A7G9REM6_9ACTN|nr:response regulator transcription factor [Nocardioides mesophilus]QNN54051.1 response regulator transcription factor [Nocardioides mesophilus]